MKQRGILSSRNNSVNESYKPPMIENEPARHSRVCNDMMKEYSTVPLA